MISGWFARLTSLILGEWVPKVLRGSVQKWVRRDHGAEWFEMDSDKRKRFSALIGKCSSSRSTTSEWIGVDYDGVLNNIVVHRAGGVLGGLTSPILWWVGLVHCSDYYSLDPLLYNVHVCPSSPLVIDGWYRKVFQWASFHVDQPCIAVKLRSEVGTFYEYFHFLMFSTSRIDLLYNHDDVGAKSREKNWVYCGSKSCFPDVLSGDLAKWLFCGRTLAAVPSLPLKCRDCAERSVWMDCIVVIFAVQCTLLECNVYCVLSTTFTTLCRVSNVYGEYVIYIVEDRVKSLG